MRKLLEIALGHDGRYLPWDHIRSIGPRQIRITGTAAGLPRPEPLGRTPLHREPTEGSWRVRR